MIGVIGGNGVAATNKLLSLIEENKTINGAFRDAHHPEMIIWQATQAPSRSMYLEGRGPSWIEDYVNIAGNLKELGCTEICMCCNTAHYAIDLLEEKTNVKFINLLDLVAKKIGGGKRVGLMVSEGLKKEKLYDKYFRNIASDIQVIYPNEEYQALVTKGICNAKNKIRFENPKDNIEHPYNCFNRVVDYFISQEVDCIVAGCTDICNVYTPNDLQLKNNIQYIDSLKVLAEYICVNY